MAPKKKNGFDDIFKPTAATRKEAAPKTTKAKAAPAPRQLERLAVDPAAVLQTAWSNHEREVLYRKAKEDKLLLCSVGMLVALVFGAAYVLGSARLLDWYWISKFVFRLFFVALAFGVAFAGNALLELNRKRLQDVLAMIVKIQENLRLFEEGAVPGSDGAFFPNTYKFIGSMNDDETNYAEMILKVSGAAAVFVVLLLV